MDEGELRVKAILKRIFFGAKSEKAQDTKREVDGIGDYDDLVDMWYEENEAKKENGELDMKWPWGKNKVPVIHNTAYNGCEWASFKDGRACDREIAAGLVNRLPRQELQKIADRKYPDNHGVDHLGITWVDEGDYFIVNIYDDSEEIEFFPKEKLHEYVQEAKWIS